MRIGKYELDNFFGICALVSLLFIFLNPAFIILSIINLIFGLKKVDNK